MRPHAVAAGFGQPDQRGAHGVDRLLRRIERDLQVGQQHVERGLAIEFEQQVAVGLGDLALAGETRLAALRDARHQPHALAEHHARQARPRTRRPRRRGRGCCRCRRSRTAASRRGPRTGRRTGSRCRCDRPSRRSARRVRASRGSACTSAVCAAKPLISELASGATPENTRYWSLGSSHEHHAQRRLVEVLGVVGGDAHAHGAGPVGDLGQLGAQVVEDLLRVGRVVVGDVEQAQRGRAARSRAAPSARATGRARGRPPCAIADGWRDRRETTSCARLLAFSRTR